MKENERNLVENGKMSDDQLSQKLGSYQKKARIWLIVGLIGIVIGLISALAVSDAALKTILVAVFFVGGFCSIMFLSGGAQKKIKKLMGDQLGDYFREKNEEYFGKEFYNDEIKTDSEFAKTLNIVNNEWEEFDSDNSRAGIYRNVQFGVANVRLNHVYERFLPHDGTETCKDLVFKGIILRIKTRVSAQSPVRVNVRGKKSPNDITVGDENFDSRFCITSGTQRDVSYLITRQFAEFIGKFEKDSKGQIISFGWDNDVFCIAIATDYAFGCVASNVDLKDVNAVQASYENSLRAMADILDEFIDNTEWFK